MLHTLHSSSLSFLASIPSPSSDSWEIGPLNFRFYGLAIGLGAILGIALATKRWVRMGGIADDVSSIALVSVIAGLFGARFYHVLTEGKPLVEGFKVWKPGLGIPGALLVAMLVGWFFARKKGLPVDKFLHAVVPGIPLSQAIGRFGNWFNQELFGRPTDLPWGLEIDKEITRPMGLGEFSTFHPTFLYESLWNFGLLALLLFLDKAKKIKPGQMLPAYIAGYGIGRFIVEGIRIDSANTILGARVNHVMSGAAVIAGFAFLGWYQQRSETFD